MPYGQAEIRRDAQSKSSRANSVTLELRAKHSRSGRRVTLVTDTIQSEMIASLSLEELAGGSAHGPKNKTPAPAPPKKKI